MLGRSTDLAANLHANFNILTALVQLNEMWLRYHNSVYENLYC